MSVRVLVIDDEPAVGMLVSYALTDANREVQVATTGRDGLLQLETNRFDAVFVDVDLGDMSGEALITMIRALHPDVPVVCMTAQPKHLIPARHFVDAYLNKPFRLAALEASLETAMQRAPSAHRPIVAGAA